MPSFLGNIEVWAVRPEGLAVITVTKGGTRYNRHLWHGCVTRKEHQCFNCQARIPKGTRVWRPITNGNIRMIRVCTECVSYPPDNGGKEPCSSSVSGEGSRSTSGISESS